MTRAHLSTEELLLQFDSELSFELSTHLDECEQCRCALVDLTTVLHQAELELQASVPAESPERHRASWAVLESRLQASEMVAAKVTPFPLRWATLYAAAAALGFVVISGYLSLEFFGGPTQAPLELADVVEPMPVAEPQPVAPARATVAEDQAIEEPSVLPAQPERALETPVVVEPPAEEPREVLARFELAEIQKATQPPARGTLGEFSVPVVDSQPASAVLLAGMLSATPSVPVPVVHEPLQLRLVQEFANLSPRAAEAVINGHWILYKADVWREDISPVWTDSGLMLQGSVENEAAKSRILRAIGRTEGSSDVAFDLRPRDTTSSAPAVALASAPVEQHPLGGVVRNSLLTHFGDTARRSFVAPEPSVLQGEIDHFVSDVFISQSELLAHVYALKNVLGRVNGEQTAKRKD